MRDQGYGLVWEPFTEDPDFIVDAFAYSRTGSIPYHTFRITPQASEATFYEAYVYEPQLAANAKKPLVVVFPILAGSHRVSTAMAKYLAKNGFHVVRFAKGQWLQAGKSLQEAVREIQELLQAVSNSVGEIIYELKLTPDSFGVCGTSMGGILGSLLAQRDDRVKGLVTVIAGANIPELLWHSKEPVVVDYRDYFKHEYQLNDKRTFCDAVYESSYHIDPMHGRALLPPTNIRMINGVFDRVIPSSCQLDLWRALGEPGWKKLPCGHYSIAPFFPWSLRYIRKSFMEILV